MSAISTHLKSSIVYEKISCFGGLRALTVEYNSDIYPPTTFNLEQELGFPVATIRNCLMGRDISLEDCKKIHSFFHNTVGISHAIDVWTVNSTTNIKLRNTVMLSWQQEVIMGVKMTKPENSATTTVIHNGEVLNIVSYFARGRRTSVRSTNQDGQLHGEQMVFPIRGRNKIKTFYKGLPHGRRIEREVYVYYIRGDRATESEWFKYKAKNKGLHL